MTCASDSFRHEYARDTSLITPACSRLPVALICQRFSLRNSLTSPDINSRVVSPKPTSNVTDATGLSLIYIDREAPSSRRGAECSYLGLQYGVVLLLISAARIHPLRRELTIEEVQRGLGWQSSR